jgi:hypothetical protein
MAFNKAFDHLSGNLAEIKYRPGADIWLPDYLNGEIIHCFNSTHRAKAVEKIYCHWFTMNPPCQNCGVENSCSF